MPLSYRETSQPAAEPITLIQAKQHLRVDFSEDDDYITALITAARQHVEKITNRAIFNRSMILTLDYFPWPGWGSTTGSTAHDYFMHWYYRGLTIRIPKPATVSVESITYLANDGVTVITIDPANYRVDLTSEPARISPTPGFTWPYQQNYIPGQVRVAFTAGTYGDGVDENTCPQTTIWAMYLLMKHWYDHREAASDENLKTIPLGVAELLAGEVFDTFDW
jgi:uncharacterized phiE125 gp8 family phage protein